MYKPTTVECPTTVVTVPVEDDFGINEVIPVIMVGVLIGAVAMDMFGIELI
jgi:hypothetical protein